MTRRLCILFIVLLCLPLAAQQTYHARVVDGETGEALPYVNIYVASERGTMTNAEGHFLIQAEPTEQLTFRYVGYETVQVAASGLPSVIKMKPYAKELGQVVVQGNPTYFILKQAIKRLAKEYRKHKKEQQVYFFRSRLWNERGAYMMEAFLRAYDAVNVRKEILLSGIQGKDEYRGGQTIDLKVTNIQRHIEIGPKVYNTVFWEQAIKPLDKYSKTKKYYDFETTVLRGKSGEKIYCIDCQWNYGVTRELRHVRKITGKLYIEEGSYRLLRFEGQVKDAKQWTDFGHLPSDIRFHITYDHSKGYTAMANLAVEGGNNEMYYHSVAFAVPEYKDVRKKQKASTSNFVKSIKDVECDSTLWTEEIILRTEEEEKIFIKGMEAM